MKNWNELTLTEKINSVPERHPYVFKCMLYLFFNVAPGVPWSAVDAVMRAMGYEKMDVCTEDEEGGFSFGAPTYALVPESDKPLNTASNLYGR